MVPWALAFAGDADEGVLAMTDPTRRTILTLGSAGAIGGALALAGCAADDASPSGSATTAPPSVVEDPPTEPTCQPADGERTGCR